MIKETSEEDSLQARRLRELQNHWQQRVHEELLERLDLPRLSKLPHDQARRQIEETGQQVDARLPDGSRVNAIIPPLALDGPSLSIRRATVDRMSLLHLAELGAMAPQMARTLEAMVRMRLNILVSGGTGTGKTTLLNALSGCIPEDDRIITIEDSAELQLQQPHVVRLETRPANLEGKGEINQRELVKNSLRMRPDRIVVGEVRGAEALDMLTAMNTGHDGSLTTMPIRPGMHCNAWIIWYR